MTISQKGSVYSLNHPTTGEIRYIGQTIGKVKTRLNKHISDSRYANNHVRCWIKGLIDNGLRPTIHIIESGIDISSLDDKEIFYIEKCKEYGGDLTNISLGGHAKRVHSIEMKQKISNSLKGKTQSRETRQKRRESSLVTWADPALRQLKREQTTYLNKIGAIGTKGKPSKKKGRPFAGDRQKLSQSLKKSFESLVVHNKTTQKIRTEICAQYENKSIPISHISRSFGLNRMTITKIAKESGLKLRNDGSKKIPEQTLRELLEAGLMAKEIAAILNCSIAQVDKFKHKYKIYANIRKRAVFN